MTAMPDNDRGRLLHRANECVNHERNASYGDPRQDFKRTASFWQIYLNGIIEARGAFILHPHDVALMIDLLKTSRLVWTPDSEDNWVDKAGYSACGYDCVMEGVESTLPPVPPEWQPQKLNGTKPESAQFDDFNGVRGAEDGMSYIPGDPLGTIDNGPCATFDPHPFLSTVSPSTHDFIGTDPYNPLHWVTRGD